MMKKLRCRVEGCFVAACWNACCAVSLLCGALLFDSLLHCCMQQHASGGSSCMGQAQIARSCSTDMRWESSSTVGKPAAASQALEELLKLGELSLLLLVQPGATGRRHSTSAPSSADKLQLSAWSSMKTAARPCESPSSPTC
jgi:hypothetical protein